MDQALSRLPPALPGPFDTRPVAAGMVIAPAVSSLVHSQVQAPLEASPSFYAPPPAKRASIGRDLEKIAAYTAALVHEELAQSQALGQRPMLRQRVSVPVPAEAAADSWAPPTEAAAAPPPAQALRGDTQDRFAPRAVNQVARVTRDTLNAIAFPTFVADLIKGTFQAIIDASIQQMEAYGTLLANVSKTVDQFMADNISDNNARDWLAGAYPGHLRIDAADGAPKLVPRDGAEERGEPDLKGTLGLDEEIDITDERAVEERLVPAARRHLARSRNQMLSTMMLMGINRIVVTGGRIGAKMGFHIQAQDTGVAESASQFDFRHQNRIGFGGDIAGLLGGPGGEARTSVAYVSSTKRGSSDSIDVSADLTGEVDLKFKSDYFPMERFAKPELMSLIMGHTPNPAANTPVANMGGEAGAARPAAGAAP
jgi:hypothetical protein